MGRNIFIYIIAASLLLADIYFFYKTRKLESDVALFSKPIVMLQEANNLTDQQKQDLLTTIEKMPVKYEHVVTYVNGRFNPERNIIKLGEEIVFLNLDELELLRVISEPIKVKADGTTENVLYFDSVKELKKGEFYIFKSKETGAYPIINKNNPRERGVVIVEK
ncbi:MAG: hypothetical protein HY602_03430 [Parcubacteria group bacterium]|nr:hypothetical protein [Parcubacteria group bacterium]